ncbi:centrosomal protein of 55 kDa isoform X2 [Oryzias melastigma]|uniref:centrosomal protein of 55 kDa isoform X2 n=1 Tax=Oryzias melastigma TaxID=30732 RepID=UPI000CF812E5|nr:centrosomal protein of 55 kDa isoform X2 [Oryzias melastigma]
MAASKYRRSLKKQLNCELHATMRVLRKENVVLKKTLAELSLHHAEFNRLVEQRLLSLEAMTLENHRQVVTREENLTADVNTMRDGITLSCSKENEEIKKNLETILDRGQDLEHKASRKQDHAADEEASTTYKAGSDLEKQLKDALEKNKQWLDYDQQREAYVKAILAKMLWLEKHLNEANQARLQQHNEEHSNGKLTQMQEHFERVLQRVTEDLKTCQDQVEMTHQNLLIAQSWCSEKERELQEIMHQLHVERASPNSCHEEKQPPTEETEDLQVLLRTERRKSANFELQANLFQRFMLNRHHEDQKMIADLMRQIKIASQDLEDEKHDCSYLRKQMVRLLKILPKARRHGTEEIKDPSLCEDVQPPSHSSTDSLPSSAHSDALNESFLECPSCQAKYAASQHQELLNHLEMCLE